MPALHSLDHSFHFLEKSYSENMVLEEETVIYIYVGVASEWLGPQFY